MGASWGLQQAIYNKLRTNAALAALLAVDAYEGSPSMPAVYDHVPQPAAPETDTFFPYVAIGDHTSADFDTDDIDGEETTITLHIWDRRLGSKRAKQSADAVYDALHNQPLDVAGQSVIYCYFEFRESVPDNDPKVQHEVIRFRIATQEA